MGCEVVGLVGRPGFRAPLPDFPIPRVTMQHSVHMAFNICVSETRGRRVQTDRVGIRAVVTITNLLEPIGEHGKASAGNTCLGQFFRGPN